MLLFLIGLELRPQRLWVMRRAVFGLGTAQLALSAARRWRGDWRTSPGVPDGRARWCWAPGWRCPRPRSCCRMLAERELLQQPRRPRRFRGAAVPGPGLHSAGRAGAAAGRRRRCRITCRGTMWRARRRHRGDPGRRPLPAAARCSAPSAATRTPEVFTAVALLIVAGAADDRHARRAVAVARRVHGRRAAVGSRIPHTSCRPTSQPFEGLLLGFFFISVGMSADLGRWRMRTRSPLVRRHAGAAGR